ASVRVEAGEFLYRAVSGYTENAARVRDQDVHARGFEGILFVLLRHQKVALLEGCVQAVPRAKYFRGRREPDVGCALKIVLQYHLECSRAGDREVAVPDAQDLLVVGDICGTLLGGTPFRERIRGDSCNTILLYHGDGGHFRPCLAAMRIR